MTTALEAGVWSAARPRCTYVLKMNLTLTIGRTVALGSTEALSDVSTRNISLGVKTAGA